MSRYTSAYVPPPPPRPEYDPKEEPPKWDWYRLRFNLPRDQAYEKRDWPRIGNQPSSDDKPDWRGVVKNNVEKWPAPQEYKFGRPIDDRYWYFDTPDYADPFKKLGYSARWFTVSGLAVASLAGMMRGYALTWPNSFKLVRDVALPWFGAGMAASTTAIISANVRGDVDDYYNYGIAGFVFGTALGFKDHFQFFRRVVLSVPAAIFVKHMAEVNGSLIPKLNPRSQGWASSGLTGDDGIESGDLRFGLRLTNPDQGRDVRNRYA